MACRLLPQVLWRFGSVAVCSVIAPLLSYFSLGVASGVAPSLTDLALALGVHPSCNSLESVARPLLLVMLLFSGPLLEAGIELAMDGANAIRRSVVKCTKEPLTTARALVVAPVCEEWVFRCNTMPLFLAAGAGVGAAIVLSAATFGLAHVHHVLELRRLGKTWRAALMQVGFQLTYTTAFGCMAAGLLYASGSALGAILMHAFCNFMGAPMLPWLRDPRHGLHRYRVGMLLVYALGLVGFCVAAATGAGSVQHECAGKLAAQHWRAMHPVAAGVGET